MASDLLSVQNNQYKQVVIFSAYPVLQNQDAPVFFIRGIKSFLEFVCCGLCKVNDIDTVSLFTLSFLCV